MNYGFVITAVGFKLLTKLLAGDKLEISKIQVGKGKVSEFTNPGTLTELVSPVDIATSTLPIVKDNQVSFIVEYRNDLNGGLTEGFWLNEFGIFANDPDDGEILLYYATLGDFPQYISAYANGLVDIRRYPVSIVLTTDTTVEIKYPQLAFMTADEISDYIENQAMPEILAIVNEAIKNSGGVLVEPTEPVGNPNKLWINPTTRLAYFWNGTKWISLAGTVLKST